MSRLDRDQARAVLLDIEGPQPMTLDSLLDRLEACLVDDVHELTVEVEEFTVADEKLARIAALCDAATADGWNRLQLVTAVRAALTDGAPA